MRVRIFRSRRGFGLSNDVEICGSAGALIEKPLRLVQDDRDGNRPFIIGHLSRSEECIDVVHVDKVFVLLFSRRNSFFLGVFLEMRTAGIIESSMLQTYLNLRRFFISFDRTIGCKHRRGASRCSYKV